jgi:hypothetical protein
MMWARRLHYRGVDLGDCPNAGQFVDAGARVRKWRVAVHALLIVALSGCWLYIGVTRAAKRLTVVV